MKFLNEVEELHQRVMGAVSMWEDYANIEFEHVEPDEEAEIRVKFHNGKNDSKIGTDSLTFPEDEPTVSFNSLHVNTSDEDLNMYVLHEFGHSLGFIGYTEEDCNNNLFREYMPSSLIYSEFDPTIWFERRIYKLYSAN